MCEELGIHVGGPKVIVEHPEPVPQNIMPKGLKMADNQKWDSNAYHTSKKDAETGVRPSACSMFTREMTYTSSTIEQNRIPHRGVAQARVKLIY